MNGVPAVPGTGYDFADFLLGTPDQSAIALAMRTNICAPTQPDLFFTDDWKVTSSLSVTMGVRWEYSSPVTEKYGRLVNLDVAPGFTAIAPVLATDPTGSLTKRSYGDIRHR